MYKHINLGNIHWQALCRPTNWATISLIISFTATIFYPLVKPNFTILKNILAYTNGISAITYLYFIIFLAHMHIWGVMLLIVGIGFLTFIPHFLLFQIIKKYTWQQQNKRTRFFFLSGVITSVLLVVLSSVYYRIEATKLHRAIDKHFFEIETSFAQEKMLGMHFIYHTKFCEWDGWRPPIHEPTLIFWLWTGGEDFITTDLDKRIKLYQAFFPNNKVKKSCSCAHEYQTWYHNDSLWVR